MTQKPLSDSVFELLLAKISGGELGPGSVVNEAQLAEDLQVSRGPIREAIRRLQGIQLISREPYFKARIISLDRRRILDLFEMREALEGMACRLAAERISKEEIADLVDRFEATGTKAGEQGLNFDFHERVVSAARNSRIEQALSGDLYYLLRLFRKRSGSLGGRREAAFNEHRQILRAIRNRDPDRAETLMRAHISRAAGQLVASFDEAGPLDTVKKPKVLRRRAVSLR